MTRLSKNQKDALLSGWAKRNCDGEQTPHCLVSVFSHWEGGAEYGIARSTVRSLVSRGIIELDGAFFAKFTNAGRELCKSLLGSSYARQWSKKWDT